MTATDVRVRSPRPTDWQGTYQLLQGSGYYQLLVAGTVRLPIELLVPGKSYTVSMQVRAYATEAGGTVQAMLDGRARILADAQLTTVVWTITAERPVELVVSGASQLNVVYIDLAADMPGAGVGRPVLPGDVLALDVMTPRPGAETFRLDQSRLDRAALDAGTPWPGTFTLGRSRLGQGYLYQPELVEWWQPILGQARMVHTRRGSSGAVVPKADVGTLAAEFPEALDPRAMGLRQGSPVRLYHWPSRTPLFTGRLTRVQVQPSRPGTRPRFVTYLEAADAVAELAGITRHGAIAGTGTTESWQARAERLMGSAPEHLTWQVVPVSAPHNPTMGNTVRETSLAAHLDMLTASARGAWWVSSDGTVQLAPGAPGVDVTAAFTDRADADPLAWSYVDATAGWDWQAVVSVATLENYGAQLDDQGEWVELNETVTATNPTLAATYGAQEVQLDTNLASAAAAYDLAQDLAHDQTSQADVTAVSLDALPRMDRAAALDLFTLVRTELRGESRTALVAALGHTITPRAWRTEIQLIERMPS